MGKPVDRWAIKLWMLFCNVLKKNEIMPAWDERTYTPKIVIKLFKYFMGTQGGAYALKNNQMRAGILLDEVNDSAFLFRPVFSRSISVENKKLAI